MVIVPIQSGIYQPLGGQNNVYSVPLNLQVSRAKLRPRLLCAGGEVTRPRFTQHFRGSLSGLTIRPGKIESQKVISCLQACKEGLDINSLESLDKRIKVRNPTRGALVSAG